MKAWKGAALALAVSCSIAADTHAQTPSSSTETTHVAGSDVEWRPTENPAFPEGLESKRYPDNPRTDGGAAVLRFRAGYAEPRHYHTTAGHSIYVLRGRIEFSGVEAPAGDFFYTPPNVVHDLVALEPSEILIWSDGPLDLHLSEGDVDE